MTEPGSSGSETAAPQQFWGRAGHRLTENEQRRRRQARAYRRRQEHKGREKATEVARRGWELGLVAPWRITAALDSGGHEGPDVDIACGAEEPAVDEWEAGTRYPTFEQLTLLAELTGYGISWFVETDEPIDIRSTTMWGHMNKRAREQWKDPILVCSDDAIGACPGTADYLETHLF